MITFDTGALIAIERRRGRMQRVVRAAHQTSTRIVVPSVVLTEWWRGPLSGRMRDFLGNVTIEAVDEELACLAGQAIAATAGATTVDAIVMTSAALRGGVVYTSDVDDLERLTHYFPSVRVLHV